jgi:flagellar motor switch protein FliM
MAKQTQPGPGSRSGRLLDAKWLAAANPAAGAEEDRLTLGSSGILNQDEIASLLDATRDQAGDDEEGIKAILSSALVSYERLPMLEVVFDRLARLMSTSLRNFTTDNVEVRLDNITSARFGEHLKSIPLPSILGVFKAEEWENHGLITVDSNLIYSVVDVLLGGRRGCTALPKDGRGYTTIECNLVERMLRVVLANLSAAFEPLTPVTFQFERLETNPRFATIARHTNATIIVSLWVEMGDRSGRIEVMIPYATLEPVRELLLQMFIGEKFGRDSIWEGHLTAELWQTEVSIQAVLDGAELSLGDVLNWQEGSQILLNSTPDSTVELRCGETAMFEAKMGQKGGNIAVQLAGKIKKRGNTL